jgi:hypothetical protein
MAVKRSRLNADVTKLLDDLKHPLREEIEQLRLDILGASGSLSENVKWNGPNYAVGEEDRITMHVKGPKQIQVIFHRGAKVLASPKNRLIADPSGLLLWKANDRAIATFKNAADISSTKVAFARIVAEWVKAGL